MLTKQEYQKYLFSSHWRTLRTVALERGKHACACCGSKQSLHVHHKSYKRIKAERVSDLIVLCQDCHREVHELVRDKSLTRMDTWSAPKKLARKYKHLREARAEEVKPCAAPVNRTIAIRRRNGLEHVVTACL